jgi:RHS repeat-associated protein
LTTTNTWDNLQRLTRLDFPDATSITNTYSKLDLVQTVDRMGFTNSFGYDSMRRKILETNANGVVKAYGYCNCGSLTSITNAVGTAVQAVTQYLLDNQANVTNILYSDSYSVTNFYNALQQLTNTVDSAGVSVTNWFDNQGLKYAASNYFGQVFNVTFDILDRTATNVDANGVSTVMTYDNLNRILTRTYPDTGVEQFVYTSGVAGPTSYTNQLLERTLYFYDAAARKTAETNANNEGTEFSYDPAGDLLTRTDGRNQVTTWHYDIYGLPSNKVDNDGNTVLVYHYDPDQRLTNRYSVVKGNTYYSYDKVGNLTKTTYPVSPAISLVYDPLNRLTNMVDAVGTTYYGYDAAGHLLSEDGPWNDDTVSYTYTNRLRTSLSLQAPNSDPWTQTYAYDGARRLTTTASPAGSFGYTYDSTRQLRVRELMLPNSAYITNSYDILAQLLSTELENSGNTILNAHLYGYNVGNQRTNQTFLDNNYQNYTYDKIGQLTSALGKESGGATNRLQEQLQYAYDAAHNLKIRTNNALVQTFIVNDLNELSNIAHTGTLTVAGTSTSPATSVTVNSIGAATYADATFAATNFGVTNGNNMFTAIANDSLGRSATNSITVNLPATNNYVYDLNGNLLSDGYRAFAYDDENELISVTVTNTWMTQFVYDGKMRLRIRKEFTWVAGSWAIYSTDTHYIYDGNLVIQERDFDNVPTVTYTRGNDYGGSLQGAGGIGGLLARSQFQANTPQLVSPHAYYHCDGNGNITALVNSLQLMVAKYQYDPYGNLTSLSGPLAGANVYRFSSKEFYVNSGLYSFGRRFYEPNLQRWLNRDPIGELGGLNLYAYSANNPINAIDAYGTDETTAKSIDALGLAFEGVSETGAAAWTIGVNNASANVTLYTSGWQTGNGSTTIVGTVGTFAKFSSASLTVVGIGYGFDEALTGKQSWVQFGGDTAVSGTAWGLSQSGLTIGGAEAGGPLGFALGLGYFAGGQINNNVPAVSDAAYEAWLLLMGSYDPGAAITNPLFPYDPANVYIDPLFSMGPGNYYLNPYGARMFLLHPFVPCP